MTEAFWVPAVYMISPPNTYWALPAMFLGIVTSVFPMYWLYKALLRDRFAAYMRTSSERAGFDSMAAIRGMGVMGAIGTVLFLVCGVNSVTRFKEDEIRVGHAFAFRATVHSYHDVSRILLRSTFRAPNGNTVYRPHYVIQFSDGTEWSTRDGIRDPDPVLDEKLAMFVAAKSGHAIQTS